jgi:hypothetical protein
MRLRLCLLLCLLFSAVALNAAQAYGDSVAEVRVVHVVSGTGLVDVYLNDSYAGQLDFARASQFISAPEGTVTLRLFAPGSDPSGTPAFTGEFTVRNEQLINVVLSGTNESIALNTYPVDRAPLEFGMSRVNVIHAIPNQPALTVNAVPASGDPITLASDLAYGANAQLEIPVGLYNFDLVTVPSTQTLRVHAGASYSVILVPTADVAQPVNALIFANSTVLDAPAGYVRFVNLSVSPLALAINGALAADLPSQITTVYIALEAGSYELALYRAEEYGTDAEPLVTGTVDVVDGVWQTSVIDGQPEASSVVFFEDDMTMPPDGQTRLTIINVHTDPVQFVLDDVVVLEALQPANADAVYLTTEPHHIDTTVLGESVFAVGDFYALPDSSFNLRTLVVGVNGAVMLLACAVQ